MHTSAYYHFYRSMSTSNAIKNHTAMEDQSLLDMDNQWFPAQPYASPMP